MSETNPIPKERAFHLTINGVPKCVGDFQFMSKEDRAWASAVLIEFPQGFTCSYSGMGETDRELILSILRSEFTDLTFEMVNSFCPEYNANLEDKYADA